MSDDKSQDRHGYVANICKCCVISIYETSLESIPNSDSEDQLQLSRYDGRAIICVHWERKEIKNPRLKKGLCKKLRKQKRQKRYGLPIAA